MQKITWKTLLAAARALVLCLGAAAVAMADRKKA